MYPKRTRGISRAVNSAYTLYPKTVFHTPTIRYRANCPGGICFATRARQWDHRCAQDFGRVVSVSPYCGSSGVDIQTASAETALFQTSTLSTRFPSCPCRHAPAFVRRFRFISILPKHFLNRGLVNFPFTQ